MDLLYSQAQKFLKFYSFKHELTKNGQKYYFIVNLKKVLYTLASSLLLFCGSILIYIFLNTPLISPSLFNLQNEMLLLFLIFNISGTLLFLPLAFSIAYTIYVIVMSSQIKKLQKFSLVLENGTVSVCGKTLAIPEKLAMQIVIPSIGLDPLPTKLMFEPLNLSPLTTYES